LGRLSEAAEAREQFVRLRQNSALAHYSLLVTLHELGDRERLQQAAEKAIPIFERHVRLNPDDYSAREGLASVLQYSGRDSEALKMADALAETHLLDGSALY